MVELKNLDNVEKLADIFTHQLNYQYEESVISTRRWKEDIASSIIDNEIKLLAKHDDFHIIYCKIESLRLGIERPIVNQLLREHPYLLVIFSDKANQNWHFVNIKYDEEIKNRRLFRRIVIGPYERLHTAAERINKLEITDDSIGSIEVQNKHDVAFDVEEVTKEFFGKFTDIFHLLCEDIEEENPACKGDCEAQAQLILNRLMFLYFIQKKGWLDNNPQYLYENFLNYWKKDPKSNTFYSQFLLKLFQAISSQSPLFKDTLGEVPFLNGGLFEIDPFTSKLPFRLHIKNSTFKNIFDELLERFNFTVREDTPLDIEVAIDPEMLGQVFENLILKLEKGEDLRRKTGSYYTPRVIVHFMCQESLKEYLITESQIEREKIESLFKMHPADQLIEEEIKSLEKSFNIQEAHLLKNLIKKAYILDPAVGSGAFLVGMLHEMVSIIKLLDVREFGKEYIQKVNYDYELKRQLIETGLYGVDIQDQAVRICELRLWLSLIVDYEKIKSEEVPPLPNLSYKIRCGDSLIEKLFNHNVQLDHLVQTDKGKQLIDEIKEDKEAYFLARDIKEKNRIELSTLAKQCELMELLIKEKQKSLTGPQLSFFEETAKERKERETFEGTKREYEQILLLAQNTRQKVESMLRGKIPILAEDIHELKQKLGISFIWKLDFAEVFKEKGGFDVVIANPPYIDSESMVRAGQGDIRETIQKTYKMTQGNWDIYVAFFELGIKKMNKNGILTFITPDKWISKPFGDELRKNTIDNIFAILKAGRKIFDSAKVDSIISFFSNKKCKSINILNFEDDRFLLKREFDKKFLSSPFPLDYLFSANLDLLSKIANCKNKFADFSECENACATSDAYKLEPLVKELSENRFNATKDFKIINTGTIGKYCMRWGKREMTYLKHKYLCPVVDRRKFIDSFKNSYGNKSLQPKIIIKGLNLLDACLDWDGTVIPGKTTLIVADNDVRKLKFLLAILNSKLAFFYIKERYPASSYNLGTTFTKDMINNLPLPEITDAKRIQFIDIVDEILTMTKDEDYLQNQSKQTKVQQLEHQIDQKVYELYGLTDKEIKLVEESAR